MRPDPLPLVLLIALVLYPVLLGIHRRREGIWHRLRRLVIALGCYLFTAWFLLSHGQPPVAAILIGVFVGVGAESLLIKPRSRYIPKAERRKAIAQCERKSGRTFNPKTDELEIAFARLGSNTTENLRVRSRTGGRAQMRNSYVLALIYISQVAFAQVQSGTIVIFIQSKDIVTVAADSRTLDSATKRQDNTQCKIATFGNYFVFAIAGTPRDSTRWDAYAIAKRIWAQHQTVHDPSRLVDLVVDNWADEVEPHFKIPESIKTVRPTMEGGNVLDSALFVATSPLGGLKVKVINFFLDIGLYDTTGGIKVWHQPDEKLSTQNGAIGRSEIVAEFAGQTTNRARKYMQWYSTEISNLSPDKRDATLAAKLVELTVLLHPTAQDYLDFPIDELQVIDRKGVHWLEQKHSCKNQPAKAP